MFSQQEGSTTSLSSRRLFLSRRCSGSAIEGRMKMIENQPKPKRRNLQWLTVAVLAVVFMPSALAQDEPMVEEPPLDEPLHMPGTIEGTGTYFEVTDSEYLDIAMASSQPVHVRLESVPQMVVMHIEAAEGASSTLITLTGLAPATTYYKYQDDYHNEGAFTTDAGGNYSFSQDLTTPHLVFIQPQAGTKYIPSDTSIGTWDAVNRIYTLTTNVSETIQIDEDNLTFDGAGYTVTGDYSAFGVYLSARAGVTIKNLSVEKFVYGIYLEYSSNNILTGNIASRNTYRGGIYLYSSTYNTVTGNIAGPDNYGGIHLYYSSDNTLANNTALSNSYGIWLADSPGNTLTGNTANSNYYGIYIQNFSNNNTLTGNTATMNSGYGIHIDSSSNDTLTGNSMSGNRYNFDVSHFSGGMLFYNHNIDTSNTVDGKPIYYVKNASNQTYDSSTNAGTLYAIQCRNITIKDLALTNNARGVYLWETRNSRIENITGCNNACLIEVENSSYNILVRNTPSNNIAGIQLRYFSNNNTVTGNTASNNNGPGISQLMNCEYNKIAGNNVSGSRYGIYTSADCKNNTISDNIVFENDQGILIKDRSCGNIISRNTVSNNIYSGMRVDRYCNNNSLKENTVSSNRYGIYVDNGNYNQIYNNDFINNTPQAFVRGSSGNVFNLAKPIGGNYWSNWTSPDVDGDGFVDNPYVFTGGQDNLPWTVQDGWLNQAPIADAGPDQTVEATGPDGAQVTLDASGSYDPDDDILTYTWTWAGGSATGINPTVTLPLGTTTVTLEVFDGQLYDTDTVEVTVQDTIPPEISIQAPQLYGLYAVGGLVLDFAASDSGSGLVDLEATLTDTSGYSGQVEAGFVVQQAGVYTLLVGAMDAAGNYAESEVFFVAYDPEGGFVTGGGWIYSEPGAYRVDLLLEGKASFGFVSKYRKGTTVPTGNTEFQFRAGDLNFHSTSYEWLVVTGSNYARFKGLGSINDLGEYQFMLWAGDGSPDTFRIKIWREENEVENVVYDNAADQPIDGGSIVVHTR